MKPPSADAINSLENSHPEIFPMNGICAAVPPNRAKHTPTKSEIYSAGIMAKVASRKARDFSDVADKLISLFGSHA